MSMFNNEAEKVFGRTAKEIGEMLEADPDNSAKIMERALFQQFIFKCRVKMENYNVSYNFVQILKALTTCFF